MRALQPATPPLVATLRAISNAAQARGQGQLGRGLRQSELRRDTPWNTYVHDGLPPTPIANPGTAAIEAALNPATTDYLYFVAKIGRAHV